MLVDGAGSAGCVVAARLSEEPGRTVCLLEAGPDYGPHDGRGPVRRYASREFRPGPEVAPEAHVRAAARGFFHPVGTCAIGRVVAGGGRVLGLDGLVVADACVVPTVRGRTPT